MTRLAGKVALVTGGASGIGAATAERLAQEGAIVWRADRAAITGERTLKLDVTSKADWDAALSASGRIDILVNAAGISRGAGDPHVERVTLDDWRQVFAVNVEGTLLGCQAAMHVMGRSGGAIVNIASTTAIAPTATLGAYGASKAAVFQLTKSVAAACALAGYPIRCNALLPGMAETAMTDGMSPEYRASWEAQIPAGRFAAASEVAAAAAFLASDDASYVNGTGITVDGGLLSRPVVR